MCPILCHTTANDPLLQQFSIESIGVRAKEFVFPFWWERWLKFFTF
jgi:hypothetical protein